MQLFDCQRRRPLDYGRRCKWTQEKSLLTLMGAMNVGLYQPADDDINLTSSLEYPERPVQMRDWILVRITRSTSHVL